MTDNTIRIVAGNVDATPLTLQSLEAEEESCGLIPIEVFRNFLGDDAEVITVPSFEADRRYTPHGRVIHGKGEIREEKFPYPSEADL